MPACGTLVVRFGEVAQTKAVDTELVVARFQAHFSKRHSDSFRNVGRESHDGSDPGQGHKGREEDVHHCGDYCSSIDCCES